MTALWHGATCRPEAAYTIAPCADWQIPADWVAREERPTKRRNLVRWRAARRARLEYRWQMDQAGKGRMTMRQLIRLKQLEPESQPATP